VVLTVKEKKLMLIEKFEYGESRTKFIKDYGVETE
jgi:hypothetical protein